MSDANYQILEVEIKNIQQDMSEFRLELKELKADVKENHRVMTDTITSMKENIAILSVIAEKQDRRIEKQDATLGTMMETLASLNNRGNQPDDNRQWYRLMLERNWKIILWILVVVASYAFGANVEFLQLLK